MARVTTVITSINSNTSEAVTISSAYAGTDGTITLSAAVPATVKVGDIITDSASNSFLITALPGGSDLTCQDFETTTDPATGGATITEAYATITLWEADLDAGTNAEAYKASDDAQGELYGVVDEAVTINGGASIGLALITLTAPELERHDGTAGGAGITRSTTGTLLSIGVNVTLTTISWLDMDAGSNNGNDQGIILLGGGGSASYSHKVVNCLIHDRVGGNNALAAIRQSSSRKADILNCLIWNIEQGSATKSIYGINLAGGQPNNIQNVSIVGVVNNGTSGAAYGISTLDDADVTVQNCIVVDTGGSSSGTKQDYLLDAPANATMDHNLASDTSASGTGSLDSKTSAAQFVDPTGPSYDLHLVDTDADAFEAGTDLVTTPTGVNIDIDGYDRDVGAELWSIGAHDGNNLRGAPAGAIMNQLQQSNLGADLYNGTIQ